MTISSFPALKPAIFCSDPTAVTETFVRRHIKLLNKGDTLVLGEVMIQGDPFSSIAPRASYLPFLPRHRRIRRLCRFLANKPIVNRLSPILWRYVVGREIGRHQFDYIIFEFGYMAARHWDYALFSRKPFFIYFRGIDASKLLKQEKYLRTLRFLSKRCSGMIFVAPTLKKNLESHGIKMLQSLVLPSGVDTRVFRPGSKQNLLCVSVGRFVEKKGHQDTIVAFAKLLKLCPGLSLIMFGDGPMLADCKALAGTLGVADNIRFPGAVDHDVIRRTLSVATFYFQSSRTANDGDTEGFPSAIQEALASGAAVVSTRHAGASDFLKHGSNAMLFSEGDVEGMVGSVVELLEDRGKLLSIAATGRRFAEEFLDAQIGIERLEKFLQRSLSVKPSP